MKPKPPKPTDDTPPHRAAIMWADLSVWYAHRAIFWASVALVFGLLGIALTLLRSVLS